MRRPFIVLSTILVGLLVAASGLAQQDKLAGRWEGTLKSPMGERPMTVIFKKDGDAYTGTMTGPRGDTPLKDVKLDGDKVTAKAEIESPQGAVVIDYTFNLQGDALKGVGAINFGGQSFNLDIELKRAGGSSAQAAPPAQAPAAQQPPAQQPPAQQRPQARDVPQPQQKQSLDYLAGQWNFKWLGRESALGPGGPKEGMTTFTLRPDGKSLESRTEGKSDDGAYKQSAVIGFDEQTKILTFSEKLANGVEVKSKGDWSSPISIRFTVEPIKVKGQTLQLKRIISVVSPHSFTIAEELSEDGGPFVRLGSGVYSKAGK
jgi:hypothetical protein